VDLHDLSIISIVRPTFTFTLRSSGKPQRRTAAMEDCSPQTLQRLKRLAVSASGFAFDPQYGQSFVINETGITALALLTDGLTLAQVALQLAEDYRIPREIASGAVEAFLRQLGRYLQ
jgi:hypothetical protein